MWHGCCSQGPSATSSRACRDPFFRTVSHDRTMSFLTLQPRLQHAVRLLQLSSLDFAQEVHDAMGRNPFLEVEDSPQDAGHVDVAASDGEGEPRGIDLEAAAPIADAPYDRDN